MINKSNVKLEKVRERLNEQFDSFRDEINDKIEQNDQFTLEQLNFLKSELTKDRSERS